MNMNSCVLHSVYKPGMFYIPHFSVLPSSFMNAALLTSLLKSRSGHMWIGLRLGTGGWWGYHWVDQSNVDYSHWALNQPTYYYVSLSGPIILVNSMIKN